MAIKLKLTLST